MKGELPHEIEHGKLKGLPVAGYRTQDAERVVLVNGLKAIEEQILRFLDQLIGTQDIDGRWLAVGRTDLERGFMAVNRAIFRPERLIDAEVEGCATSLDTALQVLMAAAEGR